MLLYIIHLSGCGVFKTFLYKMFNCVLRGKSHHQQKKSKGERGRGGEGGEGGERRGGEGLERKPRMRREGAEKGWKESQGCGERNTSELGTENAWKVQQIGNLEKFMLVNNQSCDYKQISYCSQVCIVITPSCV